MRKNKKYKRTIIFGLIIVFIIVGIYIIIQNSDDGEIQQTGQMAEEQLVEEYFEKRIVPQNIYKLVMNYTGDVDFDILYERIYYIVNDLPNLNKINAKEYYSKKHTNIEYYYGIPDEKTFIDFVKYIKRKNINTTEYEQIKFDENHVVVKNDGIEAKLVIKYSENKICTFTVLFSNRNVNPILRIKSFK